MKKSYVFDSYGVLAFFRNEPGGQEVKQLLLQAVLDQCTIWMSVVNAGEVYYMTKRKENATKAALAWEQLQQLPIIFTDVTLELALNAAILKADFKLSYADAIAASLAIQQKGILLTGDAEFEYIRSFKGFRLQMLGK
jgi:predicted nucleic acid-binding protein